MRRSAWAGYTSRKSVGSTTMIWTGLVTLAIRRDPSGADQVRRVSTRSASRRSATSIAPEAEVFANPVWVGVYVVCDDPDRLPSAPRHLERVPVDRRRAPALHEAARRGGNASRDPDRRRLRGYSDMGLFHEVTITESSERSEASHANGAGPGAPASERVGSPRGEALGK